MTDQTTNPAPTPDGANSAPSPGTTKVCKKCKQLIPKYADTCPKCGANLKPVFKRAWFWVVIVLLLLLFGFMSCTATVSKSISDNTNAISTSNGTSGSSSSASSSASAQKYTLTDEALADKGYGAYGISGTFTNTSGKEISYVQLEYVLKDASGAQVGTAYANTTNLSPNTPWKFEAVGTPSNKATVASYELKDVKGF